MTITSDLQSIMWMQARTSRGLNPLLTHAFNIIELIRAVNTNTNNLCTLYKTYSSITETQPKITALMLSYFVGECETGGP